ncbi:hypothetical protein [Streptomyces sp. NPDC055013]
MQDRSPAELIAGLRRRIDAYEGGAGAAAVLGPQALDDAHAVLRPLDGPEVESATAEVLAWFFWYRQRESSDPEDAQQAAWAAVRLFALIHEGIPDAATPPELDRMLAVHDAALALDPGQAREQVDWAVAGPQPEPLHGALGQRAAPVQHRTHPLPRPGAPHRRPPRHPLAAARADHCAGELYEHVHPLYATATTNMLEIVGDRRSPMLPDQVAPTHWHGPEHRSAQ